jgi:hypothetical protein
MGKWNSYKMKTFHFFSKKTVQIISYIVENGVQNKSVFMDERYCQLLHMGTPSKLIIHAKQTDC